MKISKILLPIVFSLAILFSCVCWFVPFHQIYDMPKNIIVGEDSAALGGLVNTVYNADTSTVDFLLLDTIKLHSVSATETKKVYLGGDTLGFDFQGKGLLVVSNKGLGIETPNIQEGDIIEAINSHEIKSIKDIRSILDSEEAKNGVTLKINRNGTQISKVVKPTFDPLSKQYKLGVWGKFGLNGVGTLTYIDPDSGRYGALGHPIVDASTKIILDANVGEVKKCVVLGVKKAGRGTPGEIKAVLTRNKSNLGSIDKNCESGIYGNLDLKNFDTTRTLVDLGGRLSAHPGKATIYSSIDGKNIRPYEIEIIKTNYQGKENQKNLVFKITDSRLLSITGGIVQGMSGSPIVQDGKLIGAVTHVFVNDPTKGFGIFIDNMITN